MQLREWRRVASRVGCLPWLFAAAGALLLSACTTDGQPGPSAMAPRGATVAFDSIDGPPQGQFYKLVQDLNDEAQARNLAVVSRERPAVYHVRGYLAAETSKDEARISWVWDVFDSDEHRALRITGEEKIKGRHPDAWALADDNTLRKIAHTSMDQLGSFLTSPEVAGTPQNTDTNIVAALNQASTPEAAGIFRIFHAQADPVPGTDPEPAAEQSVPEDVPLPPRRPTTVARTPVAETVAVAIADD